ncbi:MAG: hypothetical protein JWP74_770 [Marmoricola sp.]|nr:hypothetical protein [Marmoricola sp.]
MTIREIRMVLVLPVLALFFIPLLISVVLSGVAPVGNGSTVVPGVTPLQIPQPLRPAQVPAAHG